MSQMPYEYDENEFSNQEYEAEEDYSYQQQESSGVPRVLLYIGALVVVNIVLIAVDAPFYVY